MNKLENGNFEIDRNDIIRIVEGLFTSRTYEDKETFQDLSVIYGIDPYLEFFSVFMDKEKYGDIINEGTILNFEERKK